MNITIKIEGSEMADAICSLAAAIASFTQARADTLAKTTADQAVSKAKKKAVADNTGSGQPTDTAAACTPIVIDEAPQSEAVAPSTLTDAEASEVKKAIHAICARKKGALGAEKIQAVIVKHGGKNINTTPVEQLIALRDAVEALA